MITPLSETLTKTMGYIRMNYNQFRTIDYNLFKGFQLDKIRLGSRYATSVVVPRKDGDFNVTRVETSTKGSVSLPNFVNLSSVTTYSLSGNGLTQVDMNIFTFMPNLVSLSTSYNPFEVITDADFPRLKSYYCGTCNMHGALKLSFYDAQTKPSLSLIDVNTNKLSRMEGTTHGNLSNLKVLNLARNSFTDLDLDFIARFMPNVEKLNMNNNGIAMVKKTINGM